MSLFHIPQGLCQFITIYTQKGRLPKSFFFFSFFLNLGNNISGTLVRKTPVYIDPNIIFFTETKEISRMRESEMNNILVVPVVT